MRHEVQPHLSDVEGTDVESATTTSDDTDVQEAPQVKGAPKIIGRSAINDKVNNVPVFKVFYNYLSSMDGGSRPQEASKENMRRVGRLLFEIDEQLNVHMLWDDDGLSNLRATFFEGNHLLPQEQQRKPHTLRAYITALRLFYKFLLARSMYLSNQDILKITGNDVVLIRSAQELTEGWLKSLAKSVAFRNQDLHQVCIFALIIRTAELENSAARNSNLRISFSFQEDEEKNITLQQFHEMANLPMNVAVENKFLALRTRNITNIGREDYAGFRDHLIMKLLCRSGQRPGALANLTVEEFNNGQWDQESDPPPLFVTQTQLHKTSSTEGAATLFWNKRNFNLGQIYLNKLRPLVVSAGKEQFAPVTGVAKQRAAFFLNFSGKVMTGRQITRRVSELVKKAFPEENLSFHISRLRKHIVTSHRGRENPSVSATDLAKQMPHNVKTAEKHYYVRDEIMRKARVGRYLEASTQQSNMPSTSYQHAQPSAPGKRKRVETCAGTNFVLVR